MKILFKDEIKNIAKRGLAAVMAASLVMSGLPMSSLPGNAGGIADVYAATPSDANDLNIQSGTSGNYDVEEGEDLTKVAYQITEDVNKPAYSDFKGMEEWRDRGITTAPANTYSLTVATGASQGDKVLYFAIKYKDTNGVTRQQFLFPHVDAFDKSDDLLNYYYNPISAEVEEAAVELNPDPKDGTYTYYYEVSRNELVNMVANDSTGKSIKYKTIKSKIYVYTNNINDVPANNTIYYMKSNGDLAEFKQETKSTQTNNTSTEETGDIYSTYGSKVASQLNYEVDKADTTALEAFSVQDYAFQTEATIATVESIDVYIEVGSWTIQGMSIYKVDRYKGMEEYGLISGEKFLDFEGTLIADVMKQNDGQLTIPTKSQGTDSITRIGKDATQELYLKDIPAGSDDAKRKFATEGSLYSVRMDFSDVYEGGLETFINPEAKTMKEYGGIVEDMALELQYKDVHGWTRKLTLPVLLSAYGEAMQTCGDKSILGYAQRGDTIAFQGVFPDYKSIMGKPVIYVGSNAREKLEEKGLKIANSTSLMNDNLTESATDDVRIAGVSFYEGGCNAYVQDGIDTDGNTVAGATVQYKFKNASPKLYQTTDQVKGRQIKSGGSETFKMSNYREGSNDPVVGAKKGQDQFLVTITTSDKSKTTSSSDVSIKLYYETVDGQTSNTIGYKAKNAANDYMGLWPDTSGGNFLSNSSVVAGGSVSFLVEAKDFSRFTGAEITVIGDKSWVMDNITISYVQTYYTRLAYNHVTESAGVTSNFWIERSAISAEFFNLKGIEYSIIDASGNDVNDSGDKADSAGGKVQALDENGNPMFDKDGNPVLVDLSETETKKYSGDQVFKSGEPYTIKFNTDSNLEIETTKWSDVRYSMTWAQTQMNWGFCTASKTYDIAVEVAEDNDYDDGNGNSGSTNHFYFQLVFANGNSAYVLANQQLSADGFRSGRTENFSIMINQDYGALSAVRIIPEDVSSSAEPFDKLNIRRMTVSEQTKGGSYISYVFDQVGWIDIDFRDELESASSRGQRARTAEELARVFKVSYKERNIKLLCEVTYEPWTGSYTQFIGSIQAVIEYERASDGALKTETFDVVKGMADYLNMTVKSVEAATDPETQAKTLAPDALGTYSDPDYMMIPNHTDRFFIPAISDLKSIKSITFTAKNVAEGAAKWNIGSVCISQVIKDGDLKLADNEEYIRDTEVKYLCKSTDTETSENELPIGEKTPIPTFNMTYNEIVWNSDEWATPVTRVPESEDDTVNIYVYPKPGTSSLQNMKGVTMNANLTYNMPFSQTRSAAALNMIHAEDGLGEEVYFKENVPAQGFISAGKLKIQCLADKLQIRKAVVQHLKSGTVIDTYTYTFSDALSKHSPSVEPRVNAGYIDRDIEMIAIGFGPGTPTDNLIAEEHDIAIGFTYTSTIDDGQTEFQSPYVYFTDAGITQVSEGLFAEIPFSVPYVKQITGYTIAAYGNVAGNVDAVAAQVYVIDKNDDTKLTRRSFTGFKEQYALTSSLLPHKPTSYQPYGENSVTPVSMTFKTTATSKNTDSSVQSAVKMSLKYLNCRSSSSQPYVKQDITQYIQGGDKHFTTDEEQTVKFFLEDMSQDLSILSITMTPYNEVVTVENENAKIDSESNEDKTTTQEILDEAGDGDTVDLNNQHSADLTKEILESRNAFWKISRVDLNLGFGERTFGKEGLDKEFSGLNTAEKNTLSLTEIRQVITITKNAETSQTVNEGEPLQISAVSGDKIHGTVFVVGGSDGAGYKVKAYKMVGNAMKEVPDTLSEVTTAGFIFTVPQNDTDELVVYKLEIYPTDGPDNVSTVEITVEPDEKASDTDAEKDSSKKPDDKNNDGGAAKSTGENPNGSNTDTSTNTNNDTANTNNNDTSSTTNTNNNDASNTTNTDTSNSGNTDASSGTNNNASPTDASKPN